MALVCPGARSLLVPPGHTGAQSPGAHRSHHSCHSGAFLHRVMCISLPPSLCNPPGVLRVQVDPSCCWAAPVLPPAALSRYRCGRPLSSPLCPRTVMQSHPWAIFHTTDSLEFRVGAPEQDRIQTERQAQLCSDRRHVEEMTAVSILPAAPQPSSRVY